MPDLLSKFRTSLNKSLGGDSWLTRDLSTLFAGDKLREDALEELETRLLLADAGLEATAWLTERLQAEIGGGRIKNEKQLRESLKKALLELLTPIAKPLAIPPFIRPYILFVVGVNGVGKTTTIGKLSLRFRKDGL
jgi:fused signal recognition particle receptor